jgi:FkbM family methyltransferase
MNTHPGPTQGRAPLRVAKDLFRAGLRHLPARRQIFAMARTLRLPRAIYRHLPVEGPFSVRVEGQVSFRLLGHGLPSETDLFWGGLAGHEERWSLRCWARLCRQAAVIVDVGAYLGVYSLVAAAVNPRARVFGFEPVSRSHEMFSANCALNSLGVKAVRAAVGDRDGVAALFFGNDPVMASLGGSDGCEKEQVPICTLRAFLGEQGLERVDLLKIDVETFEPSVIAGLGDLLERCRPAMIVEVLSDEIGFVLERMCRGQYLFLFIDESRGLARTDRLRRVSRESRNYLLCTADVARTLAGC